MIPPPLTQKHPARCSNSESPLPVKRHNLTNITRPQNTKFVTHTDWMTNGGLGRLFTLLFAFFLSCITKTWECYCQLNRADGKRVLVPSVLCPGRKVTFNHKFSQAMSHVIQMSSHVTCPWVIKREQKVISHDPVNHLNALVFSGSDASSCVSDHMFVTFSPIR